MRALERAVARRMGFAKCFAVTGQTYPRKVDAFVADQALAAAAAAPCVTVADADAVNACARAVVLTAPRVAAVVTATELDDVVPAVVARVAAAVVDSATASPACASAPRTADAAAVNDADADTSPDAVRVTSAPTVAANASAWPTPAAAPRVAAASTASADAAVVSAETAPPCCSTPNSHPCSTAGPAYCGPRGVSSPGRIAPDRHGAAPAPATGQPCV